MGIMEGIRIDAATSEEMLRFVVTPEAKRNT
jgi:hypothetical protein